VLCERVDVPVVDIGVLGLESGPGGRDELRKRLREQLRLLLEALDLDRTL